MRNDTNKFSRILYQTSKYNSLNLSDEINEAYLEKSSGIDIFFDELLLSDISKRDIKLIERLSSNKNFIFTVHAPILNYQKFDKETKKIIEFANDINAHLITFHYDKISYETLEKINNILSNKIKIGIENTIQKTHQQYKMNYFKFLQELNTIGYPVTATIDLSHAYLSGYNIMTFINTIENIQIPISAFHMHNNDGISDCHNDLKNGVINFTEIIEYIKKSNHDKLFIIEHWDNKKESFEYINKIISS